MSGSKKYARGPRKAQPAPPSHTFFLLREIVRDERFRQLGAPAQSILLAAVIEHGDRRGSFFASAEKLAEENGRSERRVRAALDQAVECGLLTRQRYVRLNGTLGTYTFYVDQALVVSADETVRAYSEEHHRTESSGRQARTESSGRQARTESSGQNVVPNVNLNDVDGDRDAPENSFEEELAQLLASLEPDSPPDPEQVEQIKSALTEAPTRVRELRDAACRLYRLGKIYNPFGWFWKRIENGAYLRSNYNEPTSERSSSASYSSHARLDGGGSGLGSRRDHRPRSGVCPECEVGGGKHADWCSLSDREKAGSTPPNQPEPPPATAAASTFEVVREDERGVRDPDLAPKEDT